MILNIEDYERITISMDDVLYEIEKHNIGFTITKLNAEDNGYPKIEKKGQRIFVDC